VPVILVLAMWLFSRESGPSSEGPDTQGSSQSAAERADLFGPNSVWEGEFHFGGRVGINDGNLRVTVTERSGEQFRGHYVSNPGNYGWHIAGTVSEGQVRWGFTKTIPGTTQHPALVGNGSVEATLSGDVLSGRFDDRSDHTMATLELRLKR
jgi:hypothetical protein